jgi:hypothetical protein
MNFEVLIEKGLDGFMVFLRNMQVHALILVGVFAFQIPFPSDSALNPNQSWKAFVQKLCFVFNFIKANQ